MVIDLRDFKNENRGFLPSIKDEFDTDTDKICVISEGAKVEVEINSIDDLKPYLFIDLIRIDGNEYVFGAPTKWEYPNINIL